MKRTLTAIAAAAMATTIVAVPTASVAQMQMDEQQAATMLTGRVFRALRNCDIDGNMADQLTMAQVAGIVIATNSDSEGEVCQQVRAIANDG